MRGQLLAKRSPNVVRGISYLGWALAATMTEAGICRVLTSDYFYSCLLLAPFVLARRGVLDLAAAWALVSANAADAACLPDRGAPLWCWWPGMATGRARWRPLRREGRRGFPPRGRTAYPRPVQAAREFGICGHRLP